jgi:metallo-beta-lactamase class B
VKRLILIAFVLPVLVAGTTAQTIQDFLQARIPLWNAPTEPFRILGNIHYVGTNGLAIYLITSPQGHILIDTGLPDATPQIKSSIAKLGFNVADIKYLLNTHAHFDHTGGFAELKKETGAHVARQSGWDWRDNLDGTRRPREVIIYGSRLVGKDFD